MHTNTRTTYPSYKPSGLDWLGDIPSHWDTAQLNRLASETKLGNRDMQETTVLSLSYGRIVIKNPDKKGLMPENFNTYQIVNPGNIILRLTDLQNDQTSLRVGLAKDRGIITSAYVCLNPTFQMESRYLYQLLHSFDEGKHLYGMGSGVRQGLSYKDLRRELFPLPPLDEQRAIADYLDRKDDEITRFIESRRRMIALLEEKKQAIINQAVTRGLDPSVPMKDSGVEWLGEIPAHWDHSRVGNTVENSVAGIWGDEAQGDGDDVWCIRVADFEMDRLSVGKEKQTYRNVKSSAKLPRLLKSGDILLEKSGGGDNQPVGRVVIYDDAEPAITSNFVTRLRPIVQYVLPHYLLSALDNLQRNRIIQPAIKQTTGIQNLDEGAYLEYRIPVPPLQDQKEIVGRILDISERTRWQKMRYEREIELMQEYRTRLINDVVTGKVRVD